MTPDKPPRIDFKYWPFGIVPESDHELVWADRTELKRQVTRLGRSLGKHDAVTLHLLWADFGAGKTHTLLYIKQEAEKGSYGSLLPLYSALPKGCHSFLDIYRAIVRAIPPQLIRDSYQEAVTRTSRDTVATTLAAIWPNLSACFSAIGIGGESQQNIALAWLRAETGIPTREAQGLSLLGRIRSTDEAVLALLGVVRLFNLSGEKRVLMMVDEFQRVEVLRRQQQDDINAGLHGFFNACGRGMSLLLPFSFGVEANIRHFLNAELLSRVHPLRIAIPALSREEGVIFLNDVITAARKDDNEWPVSEDTVPAIAATVAERCGLTPRRLLKAAGAVFESAALDLEDGIISKVDATYVQANQDAFSQLDEGEE